MRLIDADALVNKLDALAKRYSDQGRAEVVKDYLWACTVVEAAPTVEAVPVVHGRWKDSDFIKEMKTCTVCRTQRNPKFKIGFGAWNYCPNCGAKMDGTQ